MAALPQRSKEGIWSNQPNRGIWAAGVGTSEGWVPHGCKVDGFMNTVMPQYNSQPPTRNTLARNRNAHYQRPGQNPQRSHRPPPRPPTLPMAAPKGVDNHAPPTRRHRPRDRGFVHRLTGLRRPRPAHVEPARRVVQPWRAASWTSWTRKVKPSLV